MRQGHEDAKRTPLGPNYPDSDLSRLRGPAPTTAGTNGRPLLDIERGFNVYGARMDGLRISQLASRAGVSTSTVRYYERIGLVPMPTRTSSGYRAYDADAE